MLRNLDIFQLEVLSHTTRRVVLAGGGEAFPYSDLSVGRIEGAQRTIPALVSDGITDGDCWYIVNLVDNSNNMSRYVQTVAVLGATSEDQARDWALKNIGAFIGANDAWNTAFTSTKALITYLNRPSTSVSTVAIRQKDLDTIAAQITDKPVVWDGANLVSHDPSSLLHELVKNDDCVQMMDAMTAADLPILMVEMGGELAEYDALIVDYNRLDLLMQRLNAAMQKSSFGNVKPVNVTQSKPFKKNGVTNVAALFEMSDGQSVTIVFHSPDNTPAKLAPSDTLTSWKWMLNKRDISAAVAPANGQNVQLPDLAKHILMIVEKNSARFTRANGNKAAQVQELTDTNTRISQKQEALAGILAVNKDLQKQIDEAGKSSDSFKLNSVDDEDSLFITKTLAEIKVYEDQVKEKGIPYLSTNEFMGEIDADKRSGFSLNTLKKHLQESQDTLNGLMLGRITPRKVIGTGGTKNGAIAYLNRSIERDKTAINSGGFLSAVNMVNYSGYLRKLLADSKNQESEKPYSEKIIAALVANHGWTASTNSSATKEFTGMAAGGELSDGTRMLTARFDDKGRYIGIDKDGFDSTPIPETDMDMREYMNDPEGGAKAFNDLVDAYVAKQRDALKLVSAPTPAAKSTDLSNEKRVPLTDKDAANMPYEQYAKMVFNGQIANDLPPSSIRLNEQLTYQKQLLEDFNAKRISRTKILGTPKATDKDARDYLLKNINDLEQSIATEGVSDDGIRANWEYAVKQYARQLGLRTDGKLIDDILKDISVQEQPPAQPANEPPMTNPDRDYLQSIIDGKADLSNGDDVEAKLTDISGRLDDELEPLFEQAAEAFAQYAIAQASTV